MRRMAAFVLVLGLISLAACKQTTVATSAPEVRMAPKPTLEATYDAQIEEQLVGKVERRRFPDQKKEVWFVYDHLDRQVGYIRSDGRTFRLRAHGPAELVGASTKLPANVASLLGRAGEDLRVITVASVNEDERPGSLRTLH